MLGKYPEVMAPHFFSADTMYSHTAVIFEGKGKIKHSPLSESGTHPAHIEVMSQVS